MGRGGENTGAESHPYPPFSLQGGKERNTVSEHTENTAALYVGAFSALEIGNLFKIFMQSVADEGIRSLLFHLP